jgi:hypothetical protein
LFSGVLRNRVIYWHRVGPRKPQFFKFTQVNVTVRAEARASLR